MAVNRPTVLTLEGRRALEERLRDLYSRRSQVVGEITIARDETDLTESTAYIQALHDQEVVEGRIIELEGVLREAEVAHPTRSNGSAGLGSRVTVADEGGEVEFHLVDPYAVDAAQGRISTESPVGRALLGARSGDVVTALTPAGRRVLAVRKVS
ncbi:MAG TPA: GreA/GreB family elongation factor [Candidatus Binatia bacterium]|nr:GreA/GreB family elongation factor [Candidatus Binatia bacterium]